MREKMLQSTKTLDNGVFKWRAEGFRSSNKSVKMWEIQARSITSSSKIYLHSLNKTSNKVLYLVSLIQEVRKVCIQASKTYTFLISTHKKIKELNK